MEVFKLKKSGFTQFQRELLPKTTIKERLKHFNEFQGNWTDKQSSEQGSICMDCSVPFCHNACPLGNLIPSWNNLVYSGEWEKALNILHSTNNFPEFTGRICPAPCEASCVLNINDDPVAIEHIEKSIADRGWENGWITPIKPTTKTGKNVAIIGSGPAGLAAAQLINRAGHNTTVFERSTKPGGLLRFGIPDFKLEKNIVDQRIYQMEDEGVLFKNGINVGYDISGSELLQEFDAICLTGGSTVPRDLDVPGRDLDGIHFAMEFLVQQNKLNSGEEISSSQINAKGKKVIILGGGDTGSDCLGTSLRQEASETTQFEIMPRPPDQRTTSNPWPEWPLIMRSSSSHEEGGSREYGIMTTQFLGVDGKLEALECVKVKWINNSGSSKMEVVPNSEFIIKSDLVLLAMGFLHPEGSGILDQLGVETDPRGNVITNQNKMTNIEGVFAGGDMVRGQSLVVWAIAEGRNAAKGVNAYLKTL